MESVLAAVPAEPLRGSAPKSRGPGKRSFENDIIAAGTFIVELVLK